MTLPEIITEHIQRAMLERVVCDQNVIGQAERSALFKPSGPSAFEVASSVVAMYGVLVPRLAYGLFEQIQNTDWDTAELLIPYFGANDPDFHNHEASLVSRIPDVPLDKLADFLTLVSGQICLIVASDPEGQVVLGTGFLVGPDLVVTCKHVLRKFPTNAGSTSSRSIELYFDFSLGGPVRDLKPNLPKSRRVELATDWHVASSPMAVPDGLPDPLNDAESNRISQSLDFVVLRLAEKVGLQTVDRSGGRRRRWVDLSSENLPDEVRDEDWVIIPQHPDGQPQRVDMGRFRRFDCTGTRLRYDTNTAPGSSGAPCFNQNFQLIGVHNAYVGLARPVLNQAISARSIAPQVQQYIPAADVTASVNRWSITQGDESPQVILGREKLLSWLRESPSGTNSSVAQRIYAAFADVPSAGCTFSIDIMQAETRDTKSPRAVYGQRGQQLPSTAEDFLLSLLRELGIELKPDQTIPRRPHPLDAAASTSDIREIDKLERWLSQELPDWLGNVIEKHVAQEIDARPRAIDAVNLLKLQNIPVPPKLLATAESASPVIVRANAWNLAYVVFDDLRSSRYPGTGPRTNLSGEVLGLVAALVRGKGQTELHPGLKRLRWMFLGYLPDFMPDTFAGASSATMETLDPFAVGTPEILSVFDRMAEAHVRIQDGSTVFLPVMAELIVNSAAQGQGPRLAGLQVAASAVASKLLKRLEE